MAIVHACNNYTIVPSLVCVGIIYNDKSRQFVSLPLVYVPYIIYLSTAVCKYQILISVQWEILAPLSLMTNIQPVTCQYWCDANNTSCAEQWRKCQSKSPKHVPSLCKKQSCFIKVQKLKKKVWLRRVLNPQLSWLTTVCLRSFDRIVPQLMTAVLCLRNSLYTSASMRYKRQSKADIH